jgi:hypothetical protein
MASTIATEAAAMRPARDRAGAGDERMSIMIANLALL